jgi:hypothetical protein
MGKRIYSLSENIKSTKRAKVDLINRLSKRALEQNWMVLTPSLSNGQREEALVNLKQSYSISSHPENATAQKVNALIDYYQKSLISID